MPIEILKLIVDAGIAVVSIGLLGYLLFSLIGAVNVYVTLERKEITDKLSTLEQKIDRLFIGIERQSMAILKLRETSLKHTKNETDRS